MNAKPDLEQKVRTNRLLMSDSLIREGKYPDIAQFGRFFRFCHSGRFVCRLEVVC
jgi:hypothetical protein